MSITERRETVSPRDAAAGLPSLVLVTAPTGFAIVDKPAGMTSHDVVTRLRRLAGTRRVGHGGTLDPMATGVLVVAIGQITRLLTYVSGREKSYAATVRLGQSTLTDDAEGEITASAVSDAAIRDGLAAMVGDIAQIPSAVSAVKIDGKRAYKRVRDGEDVQLPPRQVTISRLDVTGIARAEHLDVDIAVDCSSGTYIRAIARDLGAALGVGGHLTALRRTSVGDFTLDESATLDDLAARDFPVTHSTTRTVRRLLPCRTVDAESARVLSHGGRLPPIGRHGPYAVLGPDDEVIGVVVERDGAARPEMVLPRS
jgi:tRNA pseudouridine55 synthase